MIACYLLCMNTCAKTTKLHKGYVDIDNMLFDSINKSRIYLYTKYTIFRSRQLVDSNYRNKIRNSNVQCDLPSYSTQLIVNMIL